MQIFGSLFLLLAGVMFSSLVEGQPVPSGRVNITIPVAVTAQNLALPATLNLANLDTIIEPLIAAPLLATASGAFNIAATYCEPVTTNTTLYQTLQFLVHE
jgi:hypothetical protein